MPFWEARVKAFLACEMSWIGYLRLLGNANCDFGIFLRRVALSFAILGHFLLRLPFAIRRAVLIGNPLRVRDAVLPAFRRFCLVVAIRTRPPCAPALLAWRRT